jgi:twitching motility protein PilT
MSQEGGLIGQIAVQSGLITREQLRVATREQCRRPGRRLGEVLVDLGFIDDGALGGLLAAQARAEEQKRRAAATSTPPPQKNVPDGVAIGAIALKRVAVPRAPSEARREDSRREEEAARMAAEARAWLDGLLAEAVTAGASDIALITEQPVRLRRFGRWHDFTTGPVGAAGTERLLSAVLGEEARAGLEQHSQVCVSYEAQGAGRLRLSVQKQARGLGAIFHHAGIGPVSPGPQELGLPPATVALGNFTNGLVVVAGPLGSGRSTTLSALVGLMGDERSDHILVVQSPSEHVRAARTLALVTQVEVGRHAATVAAAIADAPLYDADVICVDDLPADAVDAALQAADGEQLVIASVAALGVVRAIEGLVDAFPESERRSACRLVGDTLRAVVAQRLLPSRDEASFVLAFELLMVDDGISALIRDDQIGHIHAAIESGHVYGSSLLDDSLAALVESGHVSLEQARGHARQPGRFAAQGGRD